MSKYVYRSPTQDGYRLERLSRKDQKALLLKCGYTKHLWMKVPAKFVSRQGEVRVEVLTSTPVKILNTVLLPLGFLVHGLANWREVWADRKREFNEREYGAFEIHRFREVPGQPQA